MRKSGARELPPPPPARTSADLPMPGSPSMITERPRLALAADWHTGPVAGHIEQTSLTGHLLNKRAFQTLIRQTSVLHCAISGHAAQIVRNLVMNGVNGILLHEATPFSLFEIFVSDALLCV